jgi:hypothetical protein
MATEKDTQEMIARITAQVIREVEAHERAFNVADLNLHVKNLIDLGGNPSAWKISNDTSGGTVARTSDKPIMGSDSAWTITYET